MSVVSCFILDCGDYRPWSVQFPSKRSWTDCDNSKMNKVMIIWKLAKRKILLKRNDFCVIRRPAEMNLLHRRKLPAESEQATRELPSTCAKTNACNCENKFPWTGMMNDCLKRLRNRFHYSRPILTSLVTCYSVCFQHPSNLGSVQNSFVPVEPSCEDWIFTKCSTL